MRDFRTLNVWEKAYRLCLDMYSITKGISSKEEFGILKIYDLKFNNETIHIKKMLYKFSLSLI